MFFVMIGFLAITLVGTAAVIVLGDAKLSKQASKLTELKVENKSLEAEQSSLVQAKKDLIKYSELEKISKSVVPQDKDQAQAVREIVQIAQASKINLKSVTFAPSNLGVGASAAATSTTTTTPAAGATAAPTAITQAKPVDGIKGVYAMDITILPDTSERNPITYYQFLEFLNRLENNRRTAQVTQIKVDPTSTDKNNPYVTFTLSVSIFLKP